MNQIKVHPHGTHHRYILNACRCDECRHAAAISRYKYSRQLEHEGPARVDAAQSYRELKQIRKTGMTWKTLAEKTGLNDHTVKKIGSGRRAFVYSSTRDKIHLLWCDTFGENGEMYDHKHPYRVLSGNGRNAVARWPKAPLIEKYIVKHGALPEGLRKRIAAAKRPMMSTRTADHLAVELGFMPWEVWDGWDERVTA